MTGLRPRFLVVAFLLLMTSCAAAHTSNTSMAEAEWNPKSQRFEIAMRLRIADLEDALSAEQGKRIRLETDNPIDAILKYLTRSFSVTFASQRNCRLHWVGLELELHDVWLYFEAEPTAAHGTTSAVQAAAVPPSPLPQKVTTWSALLADNVTFAECFEAIGVSDGRTVHVHDSVLCDIQPEQSNLVTVRVADVSRTLVFGHDHGVTTTETAKALRFPNSAQP